MDPRKDHIPHAAFPQQGEGTPRLRAGQPHALDKGPIAGLRLSRPMLQPVGSLLDGDSAAALSHGHEGPSTSGEKICSVQYRLVVATQAVYLGAYLSGASSARRKFPIS